MVEWETFVRVDPFIEQHIETNTSMIISYYAICFNHSEADRAPM